MTQRETIDRAYGNVPKEVPGNIGLFDWLPTYRGVKYYWLRFVRKIQGRGRNECDCGHGH